MFKASADVLHCLQCRSKQKNSKWLETKRNEVRNLHLSFVYFVLCARWNGGQRSSEPVSENFPLRVRRREVVGHCESPFKSVRKNSIGQNHHYRRIVHERKADIQLRRIVRAAPDGGRVTQKHCLEQVNWVSVEVSAAIYHSGSDADLRKRPVNLLESGAAYDEWRRNLHATAARAHIAFENANRFSLLHAARERISFWPISRSFTSRRTRSCNFGPLWIWRQRQAYTTTSWHVRPIGRSIQNNSVGCWRWANRARHLAMAGGDFWKAAYTVHFPLHGHNDLQQAGGVCRSLLLLNRWQYSAKPSRNPIGIWRPQFERPDRGGQAAYRRKVHHHASRIPAG